MGVSHRYRLLSVRGPRIAIRARRGAASLALALASALQDASSRRRDASACFAAVLLSQSRLQSLPCKSHTVVYREA